LVSAHDFQLRRTEGGKTKGKQRRKGRRLFKPRCRGEGKGKKKGKINYADESDLTQEE